MRLITAIPVEPDMYRVTFFESKEDMRYKTEEVVTKKQVKKKL